MLVTKEIIKKFQNEFAVLDSQGTGQQDLIYIFMSSVRTKKLMNVKVRRHQFWL